MSDLDTNSLIWRMFVSVTLDAAEFILERINPRIYVLPKISHN